MSDPNGYTAGYNYPATPAPASAPVYDGALATTQTGWNITPPLGEPTVVDALPGMIVWGGGAGVLLVFLLAIFGSELYDVLWGAKKRAKRRAADQQAFRDQVNWAVDAELERREQEQAALAQVQTPQVQAAR